MLKHGETIVDMMGGEIDRIEMKLRVSFMQKKLICTKYKFCSILEKSS